MSERLAPARIVLWPRDARLPAAPGRAPALRHEPLAGLAGFDWRWRQVFARGREEAFVAAALGQGGSVPEALRHAGPGDLTVAAVQAAFVAARGAGGAAVAKVTLGQVLALLRGCYVVLPPELRRPAACLAAAVAARCGLGVHLACADKEAVPELLALVSPALEASAPVAALTEAPADRALVAEGGPGVLVGTASAFAHAWLRWGGEQGALLRAAGFLSGQPGATFSFAPLLLLDEGDYLLLDLLRHPLQLTSDRPEDASLFMLQLARLLETWQEGAQLSGGQLTAAGQAVLDQAALRLGGLWAVPSLRQSYAEALLRARACVPEQDFVLENGRLRWLCDPLARVAAPEELPTLELALRCLQGQPPVQRVRRRAWFSDFFAGYARVGAAGPGLAGEASDLWSLHGMPVLGNRPRPVTVIWSRQTLAELAADPAAAIAVGQRRLLEAPGMPVDTPCLDSREGGRNFAARIAEAGDVRVLGVVMAPRQLPEHVSSIIIAADDPTVPPAPAALARRALRWGPPGRWLARRLGAWVLARAFAARTAGRSSVVLRTRQERRTYAFTGEAREA